jgi:hypothetical protein
MDNFAPVNNERIKRLIRKTVHSEPPLLLIDFGAIGETSVWCLVSAAMARACLSALVRYPSYLRC